MQTEHFKVSNVKCGGCANAIRQGLSALPGVAQVEVDVSSGAVTVEGTGLARPVLSAKLAEIGYPETQGG